MLLLRCPFPYSPCRAYNLSQILCGGLAPPSSDPDSIVWRAFAMDTKGLPNVQIISAVIQECTYFISAGLHELSSSSDLMPPPGRPNRNSSLASAGSAGQRSITASIPSLSSGNSPVTSSSTKSTSLFGIIPSSSRMCCGMVTCPFAVTRKGVLFYLQFRRRRC
jgi:hypothetical protein